MKFKYETIFIITLILLKYLCKGVVLATTLNAISIQNTINQSIVIIYFDDVVSTYTIFPLHNPERVVIDFLKISKIKKNNIFPVSFNKKNLIKCIRMNVSINYQTIRIVCDLNYMFDIKTVIYRKIKKKYCIILIISKKKITTSNLNKSNINCCKRNKSCITIYNNRIINSNKKITDIQNNKQNNGNNSQLILPPIIVAIDAGHGGQDPGAINCHGIYEKNITLIIAKKLKKLLDIDPIFKSVMIRNGDYFLSVMDRSNLARKEKANILISIHADSSLNSKVRGASVWILSNQRANIETNHWLQSKEKYTELLGGIGHILNNYKNDTHFSHLILNLQFGYVRRVGYNIAIQMLYQLKKIGFLHKNTPEYSGFGVLRAPDIPSILVEIGFISNFQESNLLITDRYQSKIAQALYIGLKSYCLKNQLKKLVSI